MVTGASGHVGANLVRALLERKRQVRALVRSDRRAVQGLDIELAEGDIRDINSLYKAFDGAEVVYHLAAYISLSMREWPLVEQINVIGTRNVVEACLRSGVRRLIYFSSIHALTQHPFSVPVDESSPLVESRSYPPYDLSKAGGKKQVDIGIEKGLNAVIIYPTAIMGPNDYKMSYISQALLSLSRGKLPALIDGGFDWVDVRDVVQGALQAEEKAPAGSGYLLSGHWASMCDLARITEEITGNKSPALVCPLWLAYAGVPFASIYAGLTKTKPIYTGVMLKAIKSNRTICHDKASMELGYHPRPLEETIRDTLKWFEENGI